jgi:hypothetical protein
LNLAGSADSYLQHAMVHEEKLSNGPKVLTTEQHTGEAEFISMKTEIKPR